MDKDEFKKALDILVKEKDISKEYVLEAMTLALTSAYKKNYHSLSNVRVDINGDTGEIKVFSYRTVVLDKEHKVSLDENDYEDDSLEGITSFAELENMEFDDEEETDAYEPFIYDERIHITLEDARKIDTNIQVGDTIENTT